MFKGKNILRPMIGLFGVLMLALVGCDNGGSDGHKNIGNVDVDVNHPVVFGSLTGHYIGIVALEDHTLGNVTLDVVEAGDGTFTGTLLGTDTDGTPTDVSTITGRVSGSSRDILSNVLVVFDRPEVCNVIPNGFLVRPDADHIHGSVNPVLALLADGTPCLHRGTGVVDLERVSESVVLENLPETAPVVVNGPAFVLGFRAN